ncbi:MAG: 6-bladed beta-propeller, partial [Anaeromyxobacteraceae bacterium]
RLAAVIPDPSAPPRPRSFWARAFEWLTGGSLGDDRAEALERPFGVAVAPDDTLLVADPDAGALFRLQASGELQRLRCSTSEWSAPMAVAMGPDGAIYVADAGLAAIVKVVGGACTILGRDAFERPTGVAVAGDRIFVADPPRHQVVALSLDGAVLSRWGTQGSGAGQFAFPSAIALAPDGTLLVTDALNFRVARIDREGKWIGAFGTPGDVGGQFSRPKGIASAEDGSIFVSDAQRDTLLVFSADGQFQFTIGAPGEGPGQFALPSGLAIARNRLFVADSQNRRIQVFELPGGSP